MSSRIHPVILSGGAGSRLWPLSRDAHPKQFLPLVAEQTMLQQTALRVADPDLFGPLTVIGSHDHRFVIAEQLRQVEANALPTVLEPQGRNTAAAVAIAAMLAMEVDPDALILIMPADHVVLEPDAFVAAVKRGEPAARAGRLVLFGIEPSAPLTGYGYIRRSAETDGSAGVYRVASFAEKPTLEIAQSYLASGDYLWNSGIFLLPAKELLSELSLHAPAIRSAVAESLRLAVRDTEFVRLDAKTWAACPSISVDYAVFEKTDCAAVVPSSFGWTDVGVWSALWDIAEQDEAGNAVIGTAVAQDCHGCYVRSSGPKLGVIGARDLIIVATEDAVLVVDRDRDQEVKALVEALRLKTAVASEAIPTS